MHQDWETSDPDIATTTIYDHESPPTHEAEQEKSDLGKTSGKVSGRKSGAKKKAGKKISKKSEKPKARAKKVAPKKTKGRSSSKAPKERKAPAAGRRGVRKDGKPHRKPGTNPPVSEAAAKFGRKVAKLRAEKGWSQVTLAEKCSAKAERKIGQPTIANIERGVANAGPRVFPYLAKVLGIEGEAPRAERKPRVSRKKAA